MKWATNGGGVRANAAYAHRAPAERRLMAWPTGKETEVFLDRDIDQVLTFPSTVLSDVVSETNSSDAERERIAALVPRFVGKKRSEELLNTRCPD